MIFLIGLVIMVVSIVYDVKIWQWIQQAQTEQEFEQIKNDQSLSNLLGVVGFVLMIIGGFI